MEGAFWSTQAWSLYILALFFHGENWGSGLAPSDSPPPAMGDTGDIYYADTSRIPHTRHSSLSDEENILPHIWTALHSDLYHPYLPTSENTAQNISVQFMHPCPSQDAARLDPDILTGRLGTAVIRHPVVYPESSQRTTSNTLSAYASDASAYHDASPCDFSTLHIVDAPLHGPQYRRGSWPSHTVGYPTWTPSERATRTPASEPPESTSDESYPDSDGEEATKMTPMMNQFQIQSGIETYRSQALRPSVMTFQLSETMMQPVDDPENRHMLRDLLNMSLVADEDVRVSQSSRFPSPPTSSLGSADVQGSSMRYQHDGGKVIKPSQMRVPMHFTHKSTEPHSPENPAGDQRPPGSGKPQKKSKMHQCMLCNKLFPRPSGLATHMNTHTGAKPYKCIIPNCGKSFAVRSNAKRHLRTHGVDPSSPGILALPRYAVGFEKPMVTQVHDAGKQPLRFKWIAHNMSSHEGEWFQPGPSAVDDSMAFQASTSALSNSSDEDYDEAGPMGVDEDSHQGDYKGDGEEYYSSGTYPGFGAHPR